LLKSIIAIVVVLFISGGLAVAGSQGSVYVPRVPLFAICASIGFVLHWLVFIPGFIYQTEHYFDLTGSISYIASVTVAAVLHPNLDLRGLIICVLIFIWAARLGSFLFIRVKKAGQDRRFTEMKTRFWRYLLTWTLGGAWVFITTAAGLAAITSMTQRPLGIWIILGILLWTTGFSIEVIADRQKTRFRKDPENSENFITTGLWNYSRHPNYFGEIILWLGIAVIAFPTLVGWQFLTLISPFFVTFLLIKISGVRLLEEGGQKRWGDDPAYQKYLATTSVLVPLPKRSDQQV
jgi:steroid 5-alpha reductase family enzyme|tara:strand:+ start:11011 stop:11886 length:876 start_codon:yes stop_codon:yes gene_type:complete